MPDNYYNLEDAATAIDNARDRHMFLNGAKQLLLIAAETGRMLGPSVAKRDIMPAAMIAHRSPPKPPRYGMAGSAFAIVEPTVVVCGPFEGWDTFPDIKRLRSSFHGSDVIALHILSAVWCYWSKIVAALDKGVVELDHTVEPYDTPWADVVTSGYRRRPSWQTMQEHLSANLTDIEYQKIAVGALSPHQITGSLRHSGHEVWRAADCVRRNISTQSHQHMVSLLRRWIEEAAVENNP